MFNSIRWTLQLWHAAILVVALAAVVGLMDMKLRRSEFARIDTELQSAALVLLAGPDFSRDPAHDIREVYEKPAPLYEAIDPSLPGFPDPAVDAVDASSVGDWWWNLVPPSTMKRLQKEDGETPYYIAWAASGRVFRSSSPELQLPGDEASTIAINAAIANPNHAQVIARDGGYREAVAASAGRYPARVLVGKSVASEMQTLTRLRLGLYGGGAAILTLGLAGGWILTRRGLRPIAEISDTARSISGSNLTGRIPVSETKSELGSLATTLNDTFDRLESAFGRQVRFTADASHELRTPLAVINSQASVALSRPRTPAEYQHTLQICHSAARRLAILVDSLLVLARVDSQQLPLQPTHFDVGELLNECLDLVRDEASERHLRIETVYGQPMTINSDRTHVSRVVTNLITNAVRYNRDGGFVRISLRREGPAALIEIADSGVGIAPEHQRHIYERFFRADPARTSVDGGVGLGLSMCQNLIRLLGGTIEFTSAKDVGTTFVVRLPIVFTAS